MQATHQDLLGLRAEQMIKKIRVAWTRLSDDDIALYKDKRDQFLGRLEEKYGLLREESGRAAAGIGRHDRSGQSGKGRLNPGLMGWLRMGGNRYFRVKTTPFLNKDGVVSCLPVNNQVENIDYRGWFCDESWEFL